MPDITRECGGVQDGRDGRENMPVRPARIAVAAGFSGPRHARARDAGAAVQRDAFRRTGLRGE